jgi:hypothetical protein
MTVIVVVGGRVVEAVVVDVFTGAGPWASIAEMQQQNTPKMSNCSKRNGNQLID